MTTDQRDTPALQPRYLPRIIQTAGDLVPASQHRVHVELASDGLRGPGTRRA
jgi:hypothetical protein